MRQNTQGGTTAGARLHYGVGKTSIDSNPFNAKPDVAESSFTMPSHLGGVPMTAAAEQAYNATVMNKDLNQVTLDLNSAAAYSSSMIQSAISAD